MKVSQVDKDKLEKQNRSIFTGTVHSHALTSGDVNIGVVSFDANSRTTWHTHTGDQILYILEGRGVVANEESENVVTPGMAVHVTKGERHWHGGTKDSPMMHLSIMPNTSKTEVQEAVENPTN